MTFYFDFRKMSEFISVFQKLIKTDACQLNAVSSKDYINEDHIQCKNSENII